ncbi:TPA: heparinase II/III family protein [Kluyvera ascorbata]|nr:heparinase II/III family protein [Kluyvera ascorbata]
MKLFTDEQVKQMRQRATPDIIATLISNNRDVLDNPVLVPETGCATWNHYFFCPEHSVRLIWERHSPHRHCCPIDGREFSGEPYDGAWWRWLNGLNAKACYELAVLWLLTDDRRYLNKVVDILLQYARYYPDYQEHGGIPYNGPGKANAQTLCEANCHADFARGFDIVRAQLALAQQDYIAERLLCCGADFLMAHRCNQIHNHEVKIGATIGIIGAVLENETYLEFAVNSPYGLRYQLEHALLPDGLWFEGSLHYHFYALQGFLAFESVAIGSAYSLLDTPYYPKMLALPLQLLMPDMTLPKTNDCVNGQEALTQADIYEFAWWYYGCPAYGQALKHIYRNSGRNTLGSLAFGRALPEGNLTPPAASLHAPGSGLTIIRPQSGRAICLKHGPYGGEHDHYDRLGLIVFDNGKAIIPDMGTTGYGAPLHYGYYKNTFSHNTLCINGKNQPPAVPRIVAYDENAGVYHLTMQVDWSAPMVMPDSKTRVEWDTHAYRDVVFLRHIVVTRDMLIDVIVVDNPHGETVDTLYHIAGQCAAEPNENAACADLYHQVREYHRAPLGSPRRLMYLTPAPLSIQCGSSGTSTIIQGTGPDNPSTSDLEYLILRSQDARVVHAMVTDFTGEERFHLTLDDSQCLVTDGGDEAYRVVLS